MLVGALVVLSVGVLVEKKGDFVVALSVVKSAAGRAACSVDRRVVC